MRNPLWLIPILLLAACSSPPPAPDPTPDIDQSAKPESFENDVISVPVSPVQELPPEW